MAIHQIFTSSSDLEQCFLRTPFVHSALLEAIPTKLLACLDRCAFGTLQQLPPLNDAMGLQSGLSRGHNH